MEKVINSYETLFIVSLENGEEAAKATVNKFTSLVAANAEIVMIDVNAPTKTRRASYSIERSRTRKVPPDSRPESALWRPNRSAERTRARNSAEPKGFVT